MPPGAVITGATLTVYTDRTAPTETGIELHKVLENWGEGTSNAVDLETSGTAATPGDATWLQRIFPGSNWSVPGGNFSTTVSASASIIANIRTLTAVSLTGSNLVSDVQSWLNNSATNYGWFINSSNEGLSASVKRFISRNSTATAQAPVLSVTYVVSLPVTLKTFTASLKGKQAFVQWVTASETSNSYFDIERSVDGIHFAPIGRVNGSGSTTIEHAYSFTDPTVEEGKNQYRLAQYDVNGTVKYSQVITLTLQNGGTLQIKPNPVQSVLHFNTLLGFINARYFITSAAGQTVKTGSVENSNIPIHELANGQYWLTLQALNGALLKAAFVKK